MELSKAGLIIAGALLLGLATAPATARAQFSGMGPGAMGPGAQQDMLGSLMQNSTTASAKGPGNKTPDQLIQEATKGMADVDPRVRAEALDKLRYVNDPKAAALLMRGLVDSDLRVKMRAVDILGAQGMNPAVPLMTQELFLRDTPAVLKLHIVAALGRIGDSHGTLPVIEYLKQANDDRGRGTAVFALGEIGDPRANGVLVQTVTNDKSAMVRKLAQEALEKIDGELPTAHSQEIAAQRDRKMIPTDERLSKMRQVDHELQKLGE